MGYKLPTNTAASFDTAQPVFLFDRNLEKVLLKTFQLAQVPKGAADALQYIRRQNEEYVPARVQQIVIKKLEKLSQTGH